MKILFFDMEFANGKVKGSIFSLGYYKTNGFLFPTDKQEDLVMNPDCLWDLYVLEHFLSYPRAYIESQPKFPEWYSQIKELFESADMVVGFGCDNDVRALNADCVRYNLPPIAFSCLDLEQVCRSLEKEEKVTGGLSGHVEHYTGKVPENQHRSDGDAFATAQLMKGLCKKMHMSAHKFFQTYKGMIYQSSDIKEKTKDKKRRHHYYRKSNEKKKV